MNPKLFSLYTGSSWKLFDLLHFEKQTNAIMGKLKIKSTLTVNKKL